MGSRYQLPKKVANPAGGGFLGAGASASCVDRASRWLGANLAEILCGLLLLWSHRQGQVNSKLHFKFLESED